MKLKEIREAYEVLSSTFSKTSRTLALSGIAIGWFFMQYFRDYKLIIILNIFSISAFVFMVLADLLQNYILSMRWYNYYIKMKEKYHKDEEDDVKENEKLNDIGWTLYHCKFWLLLGGYVCLALCFIVLIIYKGIDFESYKTIHLICWGVLIFTLGVLVGYMLKVVINNYERMKARKE